MRHHRWRWLFFPFVFLLSNVAAQLALIDTPCLQRCFIRECNNLGFKCVCGVIQDMVDCADGACGGPQGTGRPALVLLARECGFTLIIPPSSANPPAVSTRSRSPQAPTPQPPSSPPPATTTSPAPSSPQTPQPMVGPPPSTTMMPEGSDPNDVVSDMIPAPSGPISTQTPFPPTISTGTAEPDTDGSNRALRISLAITIPLAVVAFIAGLLYAFFHRRRSIRFALFKRRNSIQTFIGEDPSTQPQMQQLPWDFPAPPLGRGSRDMLREDDGGRRPTEEFLRIPRAPEQRFSTRGSRILTPREPIIRGVGPYT